ncbi:hypothetical protein ABTY98_15990 [Streptomyces sp. NPDC096040]|uniref:hypothetical protein n=1 Tax=Streptomyces sp. NPDC096040 TaxID=3155541 RepID=UPI00333295B7
MRIWVAFMALVFVLGSGSAVVRARKGQWWDAASVFLPILGIDLSLLGGLGSQGLALFWVGIVLALAGFGAEGYSYWRTRGDKQEQEQASQ